MNRIFRQANPYADESWFVLRRRFTNEFDTKVEFDANDPGSMIDVLVDDVVATDVDGGDTAMSVLGAVWLAEAITDNAPHVWVAGWNVPGYLPDNAPETFVSRVDAGGYINDQFLRDRDAWGEKDVDDAATPFDAQAIHNALMLPIEARNLKAGDEVSFTCNNVQYWIRRRSMAEAMADPAYTATL